MKILLKKFSSFFPGKSLYNFFQNHTFENIFQKLSPRGCFWKFSKISPTSPKFNTHKKIVLHFFTPMLFLPKTPPLIYLKLKKIKGPKMDSLFFTFHFHFTFTHNHGGRRSIAGTAQVLHPIPRPSWDGLLGVGWSTWAVPAIDLLPPWLSKKSL